MFRKVARQQKVDPYQIAVLLHYIQDNKLGAFAYEGGLTTVMEELTGSPAESFETTARRYAAMPFARRTTGNRIKAFIKFNLTPFFPAYDSKGYEKRLELPVPAKPLYCMQNERWRQNRAGQMAIQKAPTSQPAKIVEPKTANEPLRFAQPA